MIHPNANIEKREYHRKRAEMREYLCRVQSTGKTRQALRDAFRILREPRYRYMDSGRQMALLFNRELRETPNA